jgi:hypothetical protein
MVACLIPLVVCAYALRQIAKSQPADDRLSDLLVQELTCEQPVLLSGWREPLPAIEHQQPPPPPSQEPGQPLPTGDIT